MSNIHHCPQCQEDQPTFEFEGELKVLIRCQICGYPVSESLPEDVMSATGAPEVSPAPSETPVVSFATTETSEVSPAAAQTPKVSVAPAEPGGLGPLVLHIDDDPVLRVAVSNMLRRGGFTPISAEDGRVGLALAKREKPVAVLLDVMMPEPDGYKVCRQFRATPGLSRLAIIMLTATTDPMLDIHAFECGADLAVRKPFEENKLLSTLRVALQLKGVLRIL